MNRLMALTLVFGLSGCATVASQREAGPRLVMETASPLSVVQGCIVAAFEREHYPLAFTPTESGGTYAYRVRGQLFWTVEVVDRGAARSVSLFGSSDRDLVDRIKPCAP